MLLDNDQSLWKPTKVEEYLELQKWIASLKERSESEWIDALRWYGKNDLFYLLNFILTDGNTIHSQTGKLFHFHQYYLDMCRDTEYQARVGGGLDYSARGTAKSTVRSKAFPIQLLLNYPDICIIIFSTKKLMAQKHLGLIKDELTVNSFLKKLYDDVLWEDPKKETLELGLLWSRDEGLTVKRKMVRRNATVEMHAFFDGGPLGSRPDVVIADDVEASNNVTSEDSIKKLKDAFSEGITLITPVVIPHGIVMISNTRFSEAGLIQSKADQYSKVDPRRVRGIPGEDLSVPGEAPLGGTPVYPYTNDLLWAKWNETDMKEEYSLQIALSYRTTSSFDEKTINFYTEDRYELAKQCVTYICIDASRGVYDPTAIWVWGLNSKGHKIWLDAVCKKMDPAKQEFYDVIELVIQRWKANSQRVVQIRVDQLGNQPWAELIRSELQRRGIRDIPIIPCTSKGKRLGLFDTGKNDRIYQFWAPMLNRKEVFMPVARSRGGIGIIALNDSNESICMVDYFFNNEFNNFPNMRHDDMLDAGALINEDKANKEHPLQLGAKMVDANKRRNMYGYTNSNRSSWMSA